MKKSRGSRAWSAWILVGLFAVLYIFGSAEEVETSEQQVKALSTKSERALEEMGL